MHLTSHITHSNDYAPYIAYYRSNGVDQLFRKLKPKPKLNPPNAHRSQIKICENRQTQNVQFPFMPNTFRILKPIQKSSKHVRVFRNTGANAFAKNQMRLAYEDKRDLYCMTCDLQLRDRPQDTFREIQRTLPMYKIDENQNEVRPPAAGIHSQQQDVFFIPPPCANNNAVGASTPVSTATLGMIHRVDPSLAVQLREDPASLAVRTTCLRVYSTIRLIRTGMLGHLAALQQWEETMHAQDEK